MTGNEAIDLFRRIVDDDSVDSELILDYLNTAQEELALERNWVWLTKRDVTTIDWLVADTYLTGHTTPNDFFMPVSVFVSGLDFEFIEVPFEMIERYKDISYRCSWDHRQKKLHFTGSTSQNRDVYLTYLVTPTEIAADAVEIANWPETALHKLLVYHAVMLFLGGTDADNITKVMEQRIEKQYMTLKKRAVMRDAKLRTRARGYRSSVPRRDTSTIADVVSGIE